MPPDARSKAIRIPDTAFAAVIRGFLNSPQFRAYAHNTRETWSRELRLAERPDTLGGLSIYVIRPALVQAFLDGLADRPGKANVALTALRRVEKWALVRDLLPQPITLGCQAAETADTGHMPWTDAQVALVEANASPALARIVTLGVNTGQRGSDLVRISWTDIETIDGRIGINVTTEKVGLRLWIPCPAPLIRALETWERQPGPICRKSNGQRWSRKQLSAAWAYERDNKPTLAPIREAGLHLHGLRATTVGRLRRAGATIPQITDMVGMSEDMVRRYCRNLDQRENAVAAVILLDGTTRERLQAKRENRGG